jgi:hypothetical protein
MGIKPHRHPTDVEECVNNAILAATQTADRPNGGKKAIPSGGRIAAQSKTPQPPNDDH